MAEFKNRIQTTHSASTATQDFTFWQLYSWEAAEQLLSWELFTANLSLAWQQIKGYMTTTSVPAEVWI